MTNSPLTDYIRLSPNKTSPRNSKIDRITIHHMAGILSVEECGSIFQSSRGSANYGIDNNGRVGLYVEECDRAWSTTNGDNDHRAVNIELANDEVGGQWHVSDKVIDKCIELCVDICKRNNIDKLVYTGDVSGNVTLHCWFMATECPGSYLKSKIPYIVEEVNKRLAYKSTFDEYLEKLPDRGYYLVGDGYKTNVNFKEQIKYIQSFLKWSLGCKLSVTGKYGKDTEKAVSDFQKLVGIKVDGSWGKDTLSKANSFRK